MAEQLTDATREFILALADDKHLMGQQHAEWIGVAPFLEEDLAFCSIGQDEMGHAVLLYALLAGDDDQAIDALAFQRAAAEYRSAWFCELPTPEWAMAFVRHWMFDHADAMRWALLADSSLAPLREIAALVEREERYHRQHADAMLQVLLADPAATERLTAAAAQLAPLALGLFEPVAGEAQAIDEGVSAAAFAAAELPFRQMVQERFPDLDWQTPPAQHSRQTRSADWQPLMNRMLEVFQVDPQAQW